MKLFDGDQMEAEIAASDWTTIRSVGEEIARQLNVPTKFGELKGSECLVDPEIVLPDWQPQVPLAEGISKVIADARAHLNQRSAAV